MRIRAIYKCVVHGLLPYWMYEKQKHYTCSYLEHLAINIKYAWRWATFSETESDINFEKTTNIK
jgi:hypothetical protein